jgi:hypothetical protein
MNSSARIVALEVTGRAHQRRQHHVAGDHRVGQLACDLCPRRGQYRKDTLARFGGDVLMSDVRHLIAECPRKDAPGQRVGFITATLERVPGERIRARSVRRSR